MKKQILEFILKHPLEKNIDLDDPSLFAIRKTIILQKKFLYLIYKEWYEQIISNIPDSYGAVVELGSGAGFIEEIIPQVIKTEICWTKNVHLAMDARIFPFKSKTIKAILMTDVLHHIPEPRLFFAEACRCLKPGGTIAMIEPWPTLWSKWVYKNFHHEPFEPNAQSWDFPSSGPLSGANGALPWILFHRDREIFLQEYPQLAIEEVKILMPFRYLLSGGVSNKSLSPDWSFPLWSAFERVLEPFLDHMGMFALIVLKNAE
jgi:SAM-dependent methyltransferase